MYYHKCGERLEELEKEWREDFKCPGCGEIVKPYHVWDSSTVKYDLGDGVEFAN